ncbi:hypothetical protein B0T16DRAFT_453868 [Cercophora newfieldiana]|uniref:Uncharacterized protein n=1 Tax=Cercophora newfieldiana TaxID=92897 RepID=A0AA40CW54_9PEZI|nr:hypothetical protein B0T16DRAFT_453868 [Cercophora newfieldiana]
MSKSKPSSSSNRMPPSRKEKESTRKTRLSIYQTEPVREGNILVQVPDHTRSQHDSQLSMNEKMDEIMRCFEQTHIGRQ